VEPAGQIGPALGGPYLRVPWWKGIIVTFGSGEVRIRKVWSGCPYLGLVPFEERDARVFTGAVSWWPS